MSHFSLIVTGDDVDEQMIPFSENIDNIPETFKKFVDVEKEYRKKYKEETVEMAVKGDERKFVWDEMFRNRNGLERIKPESLGYEKKIIKLSELYSSFRVYLKEFCGFQGRDKDTGRYGYWHNPNAKWDWYEIGGRWEGLIPLKKGGKTDQSIKRLIDIDKMKSGNIFPTFAILHDEEWVSKEKNEDSWKGQFFGIVDKLKDNTMLTMVDCHI